MFKTVKFNHMCTNNSDKFIVVGNCKDIIGEYDTAEEAVSAMSKISIGESKWARIEYLAPGDTSSIELEKTVYPKVTLTENDLKI